MNQLTFDFDEPAYPQFDKLLGTANAELIYYLQQEHDQFLYIWGEQGSGKSHILQAWVGQALHAGHHAVYIFNIFRNSHKGHLLLSADVPPAKLQLREDLRTRMSYCLAYEVQSLSKDEKITALHNMAKTRQLHIDPSIYDYLLTHWRQDLSSLINIFNDLANYSIAQGKPITLPLLRRLLKQRT